MLNDILQELLKEKFGAEAVAETMKEVDADCQDAAQYWEMFTKLLPTFMTMADLYTIIKTAFHTGWANHRLFIEKREQVPDAFGEENGK